MVTSFAIQPASSYSSFTATNCSRLNFVKILLCAKAVLLRTTQHHKQENSEAENKKKARDADWSFQRVTFMSSASEEQRQRRQNVKHIIYSQFTGNTSLNAATKTSNNYPLQTKILLRTAIDRQNHAPYLHEYKTSFPPKISMFKTHLALYSISLHNIKHAFFSLDLVFKNFRPQNVPRAIFGFVMRYSTVRVSCGHRIALWRQHETVDENYLLSRAVSLFAVLSLRLLPRCARQ